MERKVSNNNETSIPPLFFLFFNESSEALSSWEEWFSAMQYDLGYIHFC